MRYNRCLQRLYLRRARQTDGRLPRCGAELHAYIDAAGIGRTARDGFAAIRMVNWSSVRPKSRPACDDNRVRPIEKRPGLEVGFRCRSSQITSISRCVSASRWRPDRTR
jgi:hypothetical protein